MVPHWHGSSISHPVTDCGFTALVQPSGTMVDSDALAFCRGTSGSTHVRGSSEGSTVASETKAATATMNKNTLTQPARWRRLSSLSLASASHLSCRKCSSIRLSRSRAASFQRSSSIVPAAASRRFWTLSLNFATLGPKRGNAAEANSSHSILRPGVGHSLRRPGLCSRSCAQLAESAASITRLT